MMKSFLIASFFLLGALASEAPPQIVGGNDAIPHAWPWQVSIQSQNGSRTTHDCGGSLIDNQWVLTAAHCVILGSPTVVMLGAHAYPTSESDESKNGEIEQVDVANYTMHEKFEFDLLGSPYDVALVKLKRPVKISKKIQIVNLASSGEEIEVGTKVVVTGWGNTDNYNFESPPAVLQQVQLEIMDCSGRVGSICAGEEQGGKDSCHRDSGGPLVRKNESNVWVQYGIVSYLTGAGCADHGKPTVYMDVAFFRKWIDEKMKH